MDEVQDEGIRMLYHLARQDDDAMPGEDQKEAVQRLKRLAQNGNPDAGKALHHLRHVPDMHPFIKEILHA